MMINKLKILILIFFVLSFNSIAFASSQLLLGGDADVLNATTTEYNVITGRGTWGATESQASVPLNTGGTIKNLRINLSSSPGSGKSYAFTVRKTSGGTPADTALTCTVSDTNTSCTDLSNSFSVSATDEVALKSVPSGTPGTPFASWTVQFDSTTTAESIHGGTSQSTTAPGGFTRYTGLSPASVNGTETQAETLSPISGTIKKLIVNIGTAPGASKSRAFTVRKNGANTAVTCTISGAASTNCVDNTNTVTISAGDELTVSNVPSGTPASTTVRLGVVVLADTDGQFPIWGSTGSNTPSTSATNYNRIPMLGTAYNATESNVQNITSAVTLKNFYYETYTSPGSGKSYVYTVRNGADTGLTFTLANTSLTGNVTTDVSISAGDLLSISSIPSGTPSAGAGIWGVLGYIAPAANNRRIILTT